MSAMECMVGYVVGIDLGGTKIATGIADSTGALISRFTVPTKAFAGHEVVVRQIIETIYQVIHDAKVNTDEVKAIGIGSPGPLDTGTGVVLGAPNLGWHNVPLARLISEEVGIPVYLDNDANLAALGELRFGAGRGTKNMFYVTWSTGIGGGIIMNGQVYRGGWGSAGEVGHMIMVEGGPLCGCGKRGCLEALASGRAIARRAVEKVKEGARTLTLTLAGDDPAAITAAIVGKAALRGDRLAVELLEEAAHYLGVGLANVVALLDPEVVVIGGGVSQLKDMLFPIVIQTIRENAVKGVSERVRVAAVELGRDVGLIGAICLALDPPYHGQAFGNIRR